jgi:hypothetical protein
MTGSSEFTTWVALASAAIVAGLTAIYSSSPWILIPAALIGAYLGYKGERLGRRYLSAVSGAEALSIAVVSGGVAAGRRSRPS